MNNNTHIKSDAGVYAIRCLDYNKRYVAETSCNKKSIYEQKRDINSRNLNSTMVSHN